LKDAEIKGKGDFGEFVKKQKCRNFTADETGTLWDLTGKEDP
jgi:hypothetical protein